MPFGSFDPGGQAYDDFRSESVSVVVMLTEEGEDMEIAGIDLLKIYEKEGIQVIRLPIRDFTIPPKGYFDEVVEKLESYASEGRNVAFHCHAGLGRTGMMAGVMAKRVLGLSGLEAVHWVRRHITDAMPSADQARYVIEDGG
jgi:protein-tyrosine phosphatase